MLIAKTPRFFYSLHDGMKSWKIRNIITPNARIMKIRIIL